MAGYSGTPLPRKLGIKPGATVLLVDAPDGFQAELEPLPEDVAVTRSAGEPASVARTQSPVDVALLFVTERVELERSFAGVAGRLHPAGGLWVAWPKKAAGVPTDLTEPVVMEVGLANGLVDNKVCAITDVWSGLRFVVRLADRGVRATQAGRPRR